MDWINLLRSQQQDFLRRVKKIKSHGALLSEDSMSGCHVECIQFPEAQFLQIQDIARQKAITAIQNNSNTLLQQQAENFFFQEQICEKILEISLPQKFNPLKHPPADFSLAHQFSYQLVRNSSICLQIHICHDPQQISWQITQADRNHHQFFLFVSSSIPRDGKGQSDVTIWGFLLSQYIHTHPQPMEIQAEELLYSGGLSWCIDWLQNQHQLNFHSRNLVQPQVIDIPNQYPQKLKGNWECWQTLRGHQRGINCLAFTPENPLYQTPSLLATGSKGEIKLWNLNQAELICTLREYQWSHSGLIDEVECLTFSPDGRMLISSSGDSTIKIWHVGARDLVDILPESQKRVRCMAFSPNQHLLATGGDSRTIIFWDLGCREVESRLSLPGMGVHSLTFNGDKLIAGCYQKIYVWDTPPPQELYSFSPRPQLQINAHTRIVRVLQISGDGKYLISGSCDRTIKVWNIVTGELVHTLTGHEDTIHAIAIAPITNPVRQITMGHIIASGSADRTIKIWHLETGKQLTTLRGHNHTVTDLVFTPSAPILVSTSLDRTINIWRYHYYL